MKRRNFLSGVLGFLAAPLSAIKPETGGLPCKVLVAKKPNIKYYTIGSTARSDYPTIAEWEADLDNPAHDGYDEICAMHEFTWEPPQTIRVGEEVRCLTSRESQ